MNLLSDCLQREVKITLKPPGCSPVFVWAWSVGVSGARAGACLPSGPQESGQSLEEHLNNYLPNQTIHSNQAWELHTGQGGHCLWSWSRCPFKSFSLTVSFFQMEVPFTKWKWHWPCPFRDEIPSLSSYPIMKIREILYIKHKFQCETRVQNISFTLNTALVWFVSGVRLSFRS